MSEYKNITFEVQDSIGVLTVDRPKVLNALNRETMQELHDLAGKIAGDVAHDRPQQLVKIPDGAKRKP